MVHDPADRVQRKSSLLSNISVTSVQSNSEYSTRMEKEFPGRCSQSGNLIESSDYASASLDGRGYLNTLQIQTVPDGFNSGRTYYLRATNETECREIVRELTLLSIKARNFAESRSRWLRYQQKVYFFYHSLPFQTFICLSILTVSRSSIILFKIDSSTFPLQNFGTNIADVQMSHDSSYHPNVSNIDAMFTSVFTMELLINMYAHWMRPFFANLWNAFDVVVIFLSLVALGPINMPISVLRLVRAFRVIRLFGHMSSLKRILTALSASIVPELNALLIFFIVASICSYYIYFRPLSWLTLDAADSIIGVTFFGNYAPEQFGAFDLAFVTMFRVAVGETWLGDGVPIQWDDGSSNYPAIAFYCLFVLMVNWTLLQACVAVMIDSFISHSSDAQQEELLRLKDEQKNQRTIRNSLDPLLERLIRSYSDEKDLSARIYGLFRVFEYH